VLERWRGLVRKARVHLHFNKSPSTLPPSLHLPYVFGLGAGRQPGLVYYFAKIVEPGEDPGGVSYSLQSTAYSLSAGGARAVGRLMRRFLGGLEA
jgi:hypothetical protein